MKRYDQIITLSLLLILLISTLIYFILKINHTPSNNLVAIISQHGEVVETLHLNQVKETYYLTLEDGHGGTNKIEISKGAIRIVESNCPDKICVAHSYVTSELNPAVCLPHELVIEVSSDQTELDIISR